jgi:26S proteasome regulatory subunit N6
MAGDASDVSAISSSKGGIKYAGADVDAMRVVAKAYQDRSLQEFQATLQVGWR